MIRGNVEDIIYELIVDGNYELLYTCLEALTNEQLKKIAEGLEIKTGDESTDPN